MKQIGFLTFSFLFLFGGASFAQVAIPQSGIDWDASTMTVTTFTPELDPGTPAFSCFGQSLPLPVSETLANLGFSDITPEGNVTNCFQQAGVYHVDITLVDNATNETTQGYDFTIAASAPDSTTSTITTSTACNSSPPYANNSDTCTLDIALRDAFGNPVTQITEGKFFTATANTAFDATEANQGVKFMDGLRLSDDTDIPLSVPVSANVTGITDGDGNISLKALAPSIIRINDASSNYMLAQLTSHLMDFSIEVDGIDEAGDADPASPVTIAKTNVPLQFVHPFDITPTSVGEFKWESQGTVTLTVTGSATALATLSRTGTLDNMNSSTFDYEDNALPEDFTGIADVDYINYNLSTSEDWSTTPLFAGGGFIEDLEQLPLGTRVRYQMDSQNIQYISGGVSLEELYPGDDNDLADPDVIGYNTAGISVRSIGLDVEGGILGDLAQMVIQSGAGNETLLITDVTAKDVREQITSNARGLVRGASNVITSDTNFSALDFANNDVIVVNGADITIDSGISGTLPSGVKTLVIQDGNLIVDVDFSYSSPSSDSFGFILTNSNPTSYPNTGNVFVRSSIRQMVGSYYLDGGLMTNDDGSPTPANSSNLVDGNLIQLLLEGTLFAKNTLGGSLITQGTGNYFSPWENDLTDQDLARRYDLHFVRRYTFDTSNCAPSAGSCDSNDNAFVIRVDRKISNIPPPGFEIQESIIR